VGRVEARWRPGEVGEVVAVLGPWGIDLRGSDVGESTDGAGPPFDVNGELAITSGSTDGIHGAAVRQRWENDGGWTTTGGLQVATAGGQRPRPWRCCPATAGRRWREGEREGGSAARGKAMARWRAALAREKCRARGGLWLARYRDRWIANLGDFSKLYLSTEFYRGSWRCS
jgi:hypothetical protein